MTVTILDEATAALVAINLDRAAATGEAALASMFKILERADGFAPELFDAGRFREAAFLLGKLTGRTTGEVEQTVRAEYARQTGQH